MTIYFYLDLATSILTGLDAYFLGYTPEISISCSLGVLLALRIVNGTDDGFDTWWDGFWD